MPTARTRNLRLYLTSGLSAEARANLEIIDSLASAYFIDAADTTYLRSPENIILQPQDASIGGTGTGGTITIGTDNQPISSMTIYSPSVDIKGYLRLYDVGTSGSNYLAFKYNSTLSGSVDSTARVLQFDVNGGNRELVFSGNFSLLGGYNLTCTLTGNTSVTFPTTGTLVTLTGTETLTNKTMSGSSNTFSNIPGSAISPDFGSSNIITEGYLRLEAPGTAFYTQLQSSPFQGESHSYYFPLSNGTTGQFLRLGSSQQLEWFDAPGGGTVISVAATVPAEFYIAGSPITASGTLAITKATQTANTIWAGPTTGTAAEPTFRALVSDDIPSLAISKITSLQTTLDAKALAATQIATSATSGLSGGGDLSTTRNISLVPSNATEKTSVIAADLLPISDSADSNALKKITVQRIIDLYNSLTNYKTTWTSATTKVVTHNLGTRDVIVEIYDLTTYETVFVDSVVRTDTNTVTLTTSEAPTGSGLQILVRKVG